MIVANTGGNAGEMGLSAYGISRTWPTIFSGGNRTLLVPHLGVFDPLCHHVNHIVKSPLGRAMNAIRDSQSAAASLGVNVTKTKITIYLISSFMMGVIGGFYAHYMQVLTPSSVLGPLTMTLIVAMVLVGGNATIAGPIIVICINNHNRVPSHFW